MHTLVRKTILKNKNKINSNKLDGKKIITEQKLMK